MAGLEDLEKAIKRFEDAQTALRDQVREAHAATRDLKDAQKEAERFKKEFFETLESRIDQYVATELSKIQSQVEAAGQHLYDKVGKQIDILIDLSLGKHLSRRGKTEDIRPALAAKLGEWLREEVDKHT